MLQLSQIMITDVKFTQEDEYLSDVIELMEQINVDQIPVVSDGESMSLIGVVSTRSLARAGVTDEIASTNGSRVNQNMSSVPNRMIRNQDDTLDRSLVGVLVDCDYVLITDDEHHLKGI